MLPFFAEAASRQPLEMTDLLDCAGCMQRNNKKIRQRMGCGYLPKDELNPPTDVWDHEGRKGPPLTTCPAYTTQLPEVEEVYELRLDWQKGELSSVLEEGERLTDHARQAIHILDNSFGALEAWRLTPKKDGGGGV